LRKKKIEVELPADVLPLGPYVTFNGGHPTPTAAGCEAIFVLSKSGKFQESIAAELKITQKQFKVMIGDGGSSNDARLAWEAGWALSKQILMDRLLKRAANGDSNASMYILRAVHNIQEKSASVEVAGPRINFILPGSYATEQEYMKSIGQLEVADARSPEKKAEQAAAFGIERIAEPISLLDPPPPEPAPIPFIAPPVNPADPCNQPKPFNKSTGSHIAR
jgi:hypothetical protein